MKIVTIEDDFIFGKNTDYEEIHRLFPKQKKSKVLRSVGFLLGVTFYKKRKQKKKTRLYPNGLSRRGTFFVFAFCEFCVFFFSMRIYIYNLNVPSLTS